jgi:hypothetical protein
MPNLRRFTKTEGIAQLFPFYNFTIPCFVEKPNKRPITSILQRKSRGHTFAKKEPKNSHSGPFTFT